VGVFIIERKTSGEDISPGSVYWTRLLMDVQISLYLDGALALGVEADGVLYDVLYKPKLKPIGIPLLDADGVKIVLDATGTRVRTKDGKKWRESGDPKQGFVLQMRQETPEEYGVRVLQSIMEDPEGHYQRRTIVRLQSEREEARADTWQTACAIRDARRLKVFPRNPDSCFQWSRKCDYFDVCAGMADINDPFLFKKQNRRHEELESDAPKDEQALVLLTQSAIRCYRACPRRYFYRYEEQIRPLKLQDEKLRRGSSLHRALEAWSKTGGDLEAAIAQLDKVHPQTGEPIPYSWELERAMMIGYHARWEHPGKVLYVEKEFRLPLINPETGSVSRTFELGGKLDKVYEQ